VDSPPFSAENGGHAVLSSLNDPSSGDSGSMHGERLTGNQKPVLMGSQHRSDAAEKTVPADGQQMEGTRLLVLSTAEQARKAGAKTRVLLGAGASEESVSRIRAPPMLMFATHGYFMSSMPPVHLKFSSGSHGEINEDLFETASPLHGMVDRTFSYRRLRPPEDAHPHGMRYGGTAVRERVGKRLLAGNHPCKIACKNPVFAVFARTRAVPDGL